MKASWWGWPLVTVKKFYRSAAEERGLCACIYDAARQCLAWDWLQIEDLGESLLQGKAESQPLDGADPW